MTPNTSPQQNFSTRKYVLVFFITLGIFALVFLFSDFLYRTRITQVKNIEDNINRNILESEIQYSLLADASCEVSGGSNILLIDELNTLARRLSLMENQRGTNDAEVISLKKYYSLLQIKDYLLVRERAKQCGEKPLTILYFYSNQGNCTDCEKIGLVLSKMREEYDNLHVYAFDYNLGLSVIETLKSIYNLEDKFPVIVVNRHPYYGFKTREEIEALIPDKALLHYHATSTEAIATSSKSK